MAASSQLLTMLLDVSQADLGSTLDELTTLTEAHTRLEAELSLLQSDRRQLAEAVAAAQQARADLAAASQAAVAEAEEKLAAAERQLAEARAGAGGLQSLQGVLAH